jgi:hypothetical protein
VRELSLHLLDIAENSVAALAKKIEICVEEDVIQDRLAMSVRDDGKGMDEVLLAQVVDPFVTSRTTRKVGLGIPFLKAASEACNGFLKIDSQPGKGTHLQVEFQRSHIDRMPLGDLSATILTLVIGNPNINWVFRYIVNQKEFIFDDQPLKKELDDISLSDPLVIAFVRDMIETGIQSIQPEPVF